MSYISNDLQFSNVLHFRVEQLPDGFLLVLLLLGQLRRRHANHFRPVTLYLEVSGVVGGGAHGKEVGHGGKAVVVV